MIHMPKAFAAILALFCGANLSAQVEASATPEKAQASLTLEPRKYDHEGNRRAGLMYMPQSAKLSQQRPAGLQAEPAYVGKPRYTSVSLGNGDPRLHVIAVDEQENGDSKIYLDLNGNDDLTDDNDGVWAERKESEGSAPNYSGTWVFQVNWVNADGAKTSGGYGLNFYYTPDRDSMGYYRAGARVGEITLAGEKYQVTLLEEDADAMFDKRFAPGVTVVDKMPHKPVWMILDGDRYDIRGTFGVGGINYQAVVSADGSKLSLQPTYKVIGIPRVRPKEGPKSLALGSMAPNFMAKLWQDGKEQDFELADFRGKKIVVLDMWATWCGPCKRGLPHLSKVAAKVEGADVEVIALNVFDDAKAYERYRQEHELKYEFAWARDPAGRNGSSFAKTEYHVRGIPATFVIGKDGKVAAVLSGYREGDTGLEDALHKLGVEIEGHKAESKKSDGDKDDSPRVRKMQKM